MAEPTIVAVGRPAFCRTRLELLGGFHLWRDGRSLPIAAGIQHLLAYLALHDRPVDRAVAASTFWLDATDQRAQSNLRAALWRLHGQDDALVGVSRTHIWLHPDVETDHRLAVRTARSVLDERPGDGAEHDRLDVLLGPDLLPSWDLDWVVVERERLRQLRLHALEAWCDQLIGAGAVTAAIELSLRVIAIDPLRETAHRCLMRAHLAEGNRAEALRQADRFTALLAGEVGVRPSPLFDRVLATIR